MDRVTALFFQRDPVTCARELIGASFHWQGCVGRIVETEAYAAVGDPACHTWNRPGARRFVENHHPGDAYVYLNYGVHWLFNVLVKGDDGSGFVLLRALAPESGLERMRERKPGIKDHLLGAGPGKLTRAFGIDGSAHGMSFLEAPDCGISLGRSVKTVAGGRIGISRAAEIPWRFGDPSSTSLSRKF
ncbi:MAG: DNA-3-methyladenine glycosylase [Luteolibacter sp.]